MHTIFILWLGSPWPSQWLTWLSQLSQLSRPSWPSWSSQPLRLYVDDLRFGAIDRGRFFPSHILFFIMHYIVFQVINVIIEYILGAPIICLSQMGNLEKRNEASLQSPRAGLLFRASQWNVLHMTVKLGKNEIAPRARKFPRAPLKIDWIGSQYDTLIFVEVIKIWFPEYFLCIFIKINVVIYYDPNLIFLGGRYGINLRFLTF